MEAGDEMIRKKEREREIILVFGKKKASLL